MRELIQPEITSLFYSSCSILATVTTPITTKQICMSHHYCMQRLGSSLINFNSGDYQHARKGIKTIIATHRYSSMVSTGKHLFLMLGLAMM